MLVLIWCFTSERHPKSKSCLEKTSANSFNMCCNLALCSEFKFSDDCWNKSAIWEGTSFSCSYVKLSFTWRTSYLSNSFGQSIISSWPTHFPFFSLMKHPESLIQFMVQNSPFPTTLDIKIGNDEQADSNK